MAALICPECKKETLFEKTGEYETTYLDRNDESRSLKVPGVTWLVCTNCGETILDDRAMTVIESARRAAMGLLTPEEIRGLRTSLRKTQKAMSAFLGIGEKTYCRWESGSYIQSEGFDRYLRLLILDRTNADLLEQLASDKAGVPFGESLAELEETFVYLKDVRTVEERSRPFIDQLVQGSLQAA
jgi:putative zinc finger/helix-turn-helix YgiT family protein